MIPLEVSMLNAFEDEKNIQVSLNTGKVYIGKVTYTSFSLYDEVRSIQIEPSGKRLQRS